MFYHLIVRRCTFRGMASPGFPGRLAEAGPGTSERVSGRAVLRRVDGAPGSGPCSSRWGAGAQSHKHRSRGGSSAHGRDAHRPCPVLAHLCGVGVLVLGAAWGPELSGYGRPSAPLYKSLSPCGGGGRVLWFAVSWMLGTSRHLTALMPCSPSY